MLSFYKSSKAGPFQEATTCVRGKVDFIGALLLMDSLNHQNLDAISRSEIRMGIDSRFIFETIIGQKDTLAAEFVAGLKGKEKGDDVLEMPLSVAKLSYTTNVNDRLSVMAIPIGAQCTDVGIASNSLDQLGEGLTELSSLGPPFLNLHNDSAIGITVRKPNVIASLAQCVSWLGMLSGSNTMENRSSTFGQLVCQFPRGTKLSLLGLHQVPLSSRRLRKLGAPTVPIVLSK